MDDDPAAWEAGSCTASMERFFATLDTATPPGGKFMSHSLLIGAHTEQVLVGIPLEARMSRFGWKHSSANMPSLYFNRTIYVSARFALVLRVPGDTCCRFYCAPVFVYNATVCALTPASPLSSRFNLAF